MWSEQEQRRSSLSGGACPELARLLDGLERRERTFIEHARRCPRCAGEWALYKGFMRVEWIFTSAMSFLQAMAFTTLVECTWWSVPGTGRTLEGRNPA